MHASGATRAGRSHRARDVPCQDAYAALDQPDQGRAAAAVADGLGSRPLSHHGSQAACRAAVDALAREPEWDAAAIRRAFEAARAALSSLADGMEASIDDLATTLQVMAVSRGRLVAGMVGDGAVVACDAGVRVLLEPAPSEYANEVVPLSHPGWQDHLRLAEADGVDAALAFTDGLTRLLLERGREGWTPYAPFFDAFLPRLRQGTLDGDLVTAVLGSPAVDASWDDDKCLAVIGPAPPGV